jgi:hypothetical protein
MSNPQENASEKLPISDFYKVVDYVTIYKTNIWWEAIVFLSLMANAKLACICGKNEPISGNAKTSSAFVTLLNGTN